MRAPIVLLACAAAGMLGGGALIGLWALGCCLIFCSLAAGVIGLLSYDFPDRSAQPGVHAPPGTGLTLAQVLERARAA